MSDRVNLATAVDFHLEIARLHAEIERLRSALAAYTEDVSADAETKPTLTDAEREAVEWCVEMAVTATDCADEIATLRGLLERTK